MESYYFIRLLIVNHYLLSTVMNPIRTLYEPYMKPIVIRFIKDLY